MSESIGHYDILGLVGTGGLGTVYRARDTRVGRTVAVRLLGGAMPDPLRRARAVDLIQPYTALSHPHVATLFEVGEHRGAIYLAYEFVPGDRLSALTGGRSMNVRRAIDLGVQVADALAEAHALGLVHGTLSPASVVVTPKGHAKVLDFGLTAWTREDGQGQTAERPGTEEVPAGPSAAGHLAPEQVGGQPVDNRADLFALGMLLYEMVTGRPPWAAPTTTDSGVKVVQADAPAPSSLNPDVPPTLDAVVARALAKNPDERYQSAAALAADLRTAASTVQGRDVAVDAGLLSVPYRRTPWRAFVLGLLLLAAIALAFWQWQDPLRQAWQGQFGVQPEPVVVVMPFNVSGNDLSRPYYGAGLADELARRLGHVPGVTVLSRSTIRAFAGKPPQAVAREVRANLVVGGTLTPSDDEWKSLLIAVRLIDRDSGRTVWTRSYTGAAQDVIAIQARIAAEIARWLRVPAKPTVEQERAALRLVEPAAYDVYLQARDALASHDASRAAQLFQNAITADPSLLEAHTGLVEALYVNAAFDGRVPYADVRVRMREAAEAAATTDPDFAPTQLAMGLSAPTMGEALAHLRRAIEIDQSDPVAYVAIADVLREADPARSIKFSRKVVQLDPGLAISHYQLAETSLLTGEFSEVLIETARGQALAPALPWWDALRVRVRLARPSGRDSGASLPGRESTDFPPGTILRAAALHADGRTADATTLLAALIRLYPSSCEARAMAAAVSYQRGPRADGARPAARILADAEQSDQQVAWARCAAMAAAAEHDASQAATWITRAASADDGIRMWGTVNGVLSGRAGLRQRVFPWGNVADDPEVGAAMKRLEAALGRARAEAARLLQGM